MLALSLASCKAQRYVHGDYAALISTRVSAEQAASVYPSLRTLSRSLASSFGGQIVDTRMVPNAALNRAGFCNVVKGVDTIVLVADIYSSGTGKTAEGIQTFIMDCSVLPAIARSSYFALSPFALSPGTSRKDADATSNGFMVAAQITAARFRNQKRRYGN